MARNAVLSTGVSLSECGDSSPLFTGSCRNRGRVGVSAARLARRTAPQRRTASL